jgi:hypothetical protein
MSGIQRLGAIVAASLLLPNPGWAKPEVIGVVMEATHASLGSSAVSGGSSVFEGDRISTGTGGSLRVRSGKTMLYLKDESSVVVREKTGSQKRMLEAELLSGEVVLSCAQAAGTEIVAINARIHVGESAAAILQVRVLGPKTLSIIARRGTAEFFYGGEEAAIVEGKAYRVELDPANNGSAADEKNKPAAHKKRKKFLLMAIGAGAAAGGVAAGILATGGSSGSGVAKSFESPDRP